MSSTPAHRPSMTDVGARAGVSRQTVSRALNGNSYVGAETRVRIEQAMRELNFRPNRSARSLALRRTEMVGVITIGPAQALLASILNGIADAATEVGYRTSVKNLEFAEDHSDVEERVATAFESFMSEGVEGLIVVSAYAGVLEAVKQKASELPIVLVFGEPTEGVGTATIDSRQGGYIAGQHLLSLGHRRIAHVAGPIDRFDSAGRETGLREALAEHGLEPVCVIRGDWLSDGGYRAGVELRDRDDFTAIFAANDAMALGIMHAFNERARFAPRDFSIIGYDDAPDSQHYYPPLTTIRQDFAGIGERSFVELKTAIDSGRFVHVTLEPTLVVRASTAAVT